MRDEIQNNITKLSFTLVILKHDIDENVYLNGEELKTDFLLECLFYSV